MVLLSFFILFFSVEKDKKETIVNQILRLSSLEGSGSLGASPQRSPQAAIADMQMVLAEVSGLEVRTDIIEQKVTVFFPGNIYAMGAVEQANELGHLIGKLAHGKITPTSATAAVKDLVQKLAWHYPKP
jgi:hypothetical protein